MSDVVIYSLLSHTCIWLKRHLRLLRGCLPEQSRIVVVQGPYGGFRLTSGGVVRLLPEQARLLDVGVLEAPTALLGHLPAIRQAMLIDWVLGQVAEQAEPLALIIHGDVFPTRLVQSEELLAGKDVTGRGLGPNRLGSTWMMLKREAAAPRSSLGPLAHLWDAEHPISHHHCRELGIPFPEDKWAVEWCDPVWLHVNGMSIESLEQTEVKRQFFADYLRLSEDPPCTTVKAPIHKPHVYSKQERELLRSGLFVPQPKVKGVGDHLHDLILRWTLAGPTMDCGCACMMTKMNRWGPDGCRQRLDRIVRYLLRQGRKRGWKLATWPGAKLAARQLVLSAIGRT